jgi:hypothetical protein
MMSAMFIAAILGDVDVNDDCDYYHYSDVPKYVQ